MEGLENLMVSVEMITYKHEAYIKQAIEGVLMQEINFEFELIISDDCSPDATQEIVQNIIENHPKGYRIKYFRHKENIGMQANGIFAFEQCLGKYIAICEGDDYWTDPLKLQKQIDFLEANLKFTFCVHRYRLFIENDKKFEEKIYPIHYDSYKRVEHGIEIEKEVFAKDWFTQPLTAVIVREELKEVLKMQEHFHYFRDYHIFYFLLQRGKGICLENVAGVYRINDGGIASSKTSYEKNIIAFLIFEELYLYTKETFFMYNYCKSALVFIKKKEGFKIILTSYTYNLGLKDKLISIKYFFKVFFQYFIKKVNLKRYFLMNSN